MQHGSWSSLLHVSSPDEKLFRMWPCRQPLAESCDRGNDPGNTPQKAIGLTWGNRRNGKNMNVQHFLYSFYETGVRVSKQATHIIMKSTKAFHYRQAHFENFHFFNILGKPLPFWRYPRYSHTRKNIKVHTFYEISRSVRINSRSTTVGSPLATGTWWYLCHTQHSCCFSM